MESFLVTGAMGFVGSHLVEGLLAKGKTVWGIDFAEPAYKDELLAHPNFHCVFDTIKNEEIVMKLIRKVDCVCHLAAIANPSTYLTNPTKVMDITLNMGIRIAELAQLEGKLFFYTSTSEVYGKNPNVPWQEDDDRVLGATSINRWCYSTSKAAVEHFIMAAHKRGLLDYVIVRLFNIYGPRLRERVLYRFVEQALDSQPLTVHGDGKQTRCCTYVEDAVDAFIRLIETPEAHNSVYNVGGTHEVTIQEIADTVQRISEAPVPIQYVSYEDSYGVGYEDIRRRVPDVTRIKNVIGWEAQTGLEDGLRRTYAYEKALREKGL